MSFEWSHYLDLAHELAESTNAKINQEAALRCAISRAYYAVFCESRNYLRDIDGINNPHSQEVHKFVSDEFLRSTNRTKKRIGESLSRLRRMRNVADYEDNFYDLEKRTTFALKTAESILSDLDNL